jgi:CarboxypepD_reg-like domain/TonB-dependent Receptor Plug Domain
MKYSVLLFSLLLLPIFTFAQNSYTISGVVKDAENGETLIGASVEIVSLKTGTITNEYGFYSITIPNEKKEVTLKFGYLGYIVQTKTVTDGTNTTQNTLLKPEGKELNEVVVKADGLREKIKSTEMSVTSLTMREIKTIPVIFGESDILKTIQLKPGVNAGSEGTTGLFVRGGGGDQNLIVLDEAIVYNPNHLFGFFSTFNSDALKDVKIFKGGFPAQYGGRLSSVVDVRMKEGNNQKFSGSGGIGVIASRLTLEGPIVKDKASFVVSARRTYIDQVLAGIRKINSKAPNIPYFFYDLNMKVNYKLNDKDHLYLSGYFGRDAFAFTGASGSFGVDFSWGNATGTARWNHVFNPKLFLNTTVTYSDYLYSIANKTVGFAFNTTSKIKDTNVKFDFYNAISTNNSLRFGGNVTYHQFTVGRLQAGSTDGKISFSSGTDLIGTEFGTYVSDEITLNKLKFNSGIRISGFANAGKTYFGFEPRAAANFQASDKVAIKASYARMSQYVHLVANSSLALPTDVWYPTTQNVKPQFSDQVAAGVSYLIGNDILITNEYYYKLLHNQVEFKDGANLFANKNLETEFSFGKGKAYGMEIEIEKKQGKLTGWIGYTIARVQRYGFPDIMGGRAFSPRFDRRHNLTVVGIYELNKKYSFSSSFIYGSGDRGWLPQGRFIFQDIPGGSPNTAVPSYGDRNTFSYAPYVRLDAGMVIRKQHRWGESDWTIGVYNATNQRNPFFYFLDVQTKSTDIGGQKFNIPEKIVAKQVSLFPIIPSATWNFKF